MKDECPFCGSINTYHNGTTYECFDCKRKYSSMGKSTEKKQSKKFVVEDDEDDDFYTNSFSDKFDSDFDFDDDDFDVEDEEAYDEDDDY